MKNNLLGYRVGALLYTPANKRSIADSIIHKKIETPYSLALCLEDTINDTFVKEAEDILIESFRTIYAARDTSSFFLPNIFIRVRRPDQIPALYSRLGQSRSLLTGFIVPKFSLENADEYIIEIKKINDASEQRLYMMPILESPAIIDLRTRYDVLYKLKDKLDSISEYILNIRVGGNDLCHIFGYRRHADETIHDIKPISHILCDIITVFGMDYIISGPVWEYFDGDDWKSGLENELKKDRLCGFVGKTAIHPRQIPVINEAYQVSAQDFKDAAAILAWDTGNPSFVASNSSHQRMDEYKVHANWAREIQMRAEAYGIRDSHTS